MQWHKTDKIVCFDNSIAGSSMADVVGSIPRGSSTITVVCVEEEKGGWRLI